MRAEARLMLPALSIGLSLFLGILGPEPSFPGLGAPISYHGCRGMLGGLCWSQVHALRVRLCVHVCVHVYSAVLHVGLVPRPPTWPYVVRSQLERTRHERGLCPAGVDPEAAQDPAV